MDSNLVLETSVAHSAGLARFAAGTMLTTPAGAVPVETLRVADRVAVLAAATPRDGSYRRAFGMVTRIAHQRVDCGRHPRPAEVWPVWLAAHALGPNHPFEEMELAADQAIVFPRRGDPADGVVIPLRALINGATIVQRQVDHLSYFDVTIDRAGHLIASGLGVGTASERAATDGADTKRLHAHLADARRRTRVAAAALGWTASLDPDLHLVVDGRRLDRSDLDPGDVDRSGVDRSGVDRSGVDRSDGDAAQYRFDLPPQARSIWLASRSRIPLATPWSDGDQGQRGVTVREVLVDGRRHALSPGRGWHRTANGDHCTDGAGTLRAPGARRLDVTLAGAGEFWRPPPASWQLR